MRTNPAGATVSGEPKVLPSNTSAWKKAITSPARIPAAQRIRNVKTGARPGAGVTTRGPGRRRASRRAAFRSAMGASRGRADPESGGPGEPGFDLGDHARGEHVPVERPR